MIHLGNRFFTWMAALLIGSSCAAADKDVAQWLVVTAPAFRETLTPLVEHRRAEGLKVVVIESTNVLTPEQIRQTNAQPLQAHLARLCQQHPGRSYVLLVGTVAAAEPALAQSTVVPPLFGTIGKMQNQLSDYPYGCPDSNGAPAVAVGRFPARTFDEARGMVQKTLRLETDRTPAAWRNRMTVLAGNPGGGPFAEAIYEMVAGPRLRRLSPAWDLRALVHISQSMYYLPSTLLHDTATRYLEEGELFAVYLGHSDPVGMVTGTTRFMTRTNWANLNIQGGAGLFFTTACSSCRSGGNDNEGYGVAAMRNSKGPAAVIGAHLDSYSALGLLALDGFVKCLSAPPFPTHLADYWLAIQAGLADGKMNEGTFKMLDMADGTSGKTPLDVQRREHLEMWTLFGDPALRLPLVPLDIRLDTNGLATAGQSLTITGDLPERLKGAPVRVTVERTRTAKPADLEKLPPRTSEDRDRVAMENHRKANNLVLAAAETKPNGTRFECQLELPSKIPGTNIVIRVQAATANDAALGVTVVPVAREPVPSNGTKSE